MELVREEFGGISGNRDYAPPPAKYLSAMAVDKRLGPEFGGDDIRVSRYLYLDGRRTYQLSQGIRHTLYGEGDAVAKEDCASKSILWGRRYAR